MTAAAQIIDESAIQQTLASASADPAAARDVLAKARQLHGLAPADVAVLIACQDPDVREELFAAARWAKQEIYGSRLVLFAPLYISNYCNNECVYCAFHARSKAVRRRALSQPEIAAETRILIGQGHKRLLLVAGEAYPQREGLQYILDSIATIYATRSGNGEIRRVHANLAPLTVEQFRELKAANIGVYQLFQETYHRETYTRVHIAGPKRDYDFRLTAMHRAIQAGIRDVGIGALLGLYDWRFEVLAMLSHIASLEREFGFGCHTISVPRMEPAVGAASEPPCPVSDPDFLKLIAILRLAVPYTGMVMTTRERAEMRRQTFQLGISQISGGSRTDPGGYGEQVTDAAQFQLGDSRPLDEVVRDIAMLGYMPSFCTACYRMGRTGGDFMELAKPGAIKRHCEPNALSTFQEYLTDFASPETRTVGEALIAQRLAAIDPTARRIALSLLKPVHEGRRDIFV